MSRRVIWSADFTSAFSTKPAAIATSVIHYAPELALDSSARAGARQSVPFTVEGSAAGRNLRSLRVYASYDGGGKWTELGVSGGKVSVRNPASGGSVSLRADIEDKQHHRFSQTVINAYLTR